MKKVVSLGIIAVAIACVPYVTGIMAEKQFKADIEQLQTSSALHSVPFDIKIDVDYQRGWFASTAVNPITLTIPEQGPVTFKVNNHISHGPILLNGPWLM